MPIRHWLCSLGSPYPCMQICQSITRCCCMNKLAKIEDIYALSPVQEGVLFHTLYAATPSMYTSQMSFRVKGALVIAAFHEAWNMAIQRHSILRTAMIYDQG